jgi:ATP-dependent protease HslVU (ClpYQ) peptidase subunit
VTCIVGLKHEGQVFLGADSCASTSYAQSTIAWQKVWHADEFVFGGAGSVRQIQLIRYNLKVPEQTKSQSVEDYLCGPWIDAVRECFREGGQLRVNDGVESGPWFLMGYRGRLFCVESDFQVAESADDYAALGSGEEVARGSLYATVGDEPQKRIETALKAAEYHARGVRGPFATVKLEA